MIDQKRIVYLIALACALSILIVSEVRHAKIEILNEQRRIGRALWKVENANWRVINHYDKPEVIRKGEKP